MGARSRFWAALESVPGLCAVTAEWRSLLGEEYQAAARLLRPTGRSAEAYPCTAPRACACAHEVIEHGPDDLASVCRCDPRECDARALTRADVLLYEVNRRQLSDAVAAALGVTPAHAAVPRLHETWSIGTYCPRPGDRFPVIMTFQTEPEDFEGVVEKLQARGEGPFTLVAPTRAPCQPACVEHLRRAKVHLISLAEELTLGADGALNPSRPGADLLAPFRATVLPAEVAGVRRWSGRHLTAKEAAKLLDYPSGPALLKAVDRSPEDDPLHVLRPGGPARTSSGRFYEEAVAHVVGLLAGAGRQYEAGVAKRKDEARAAKAASPPVDPEAAQRRLLKALTRKEKEGR